MDCDYCGGDIEVTEDEDTKGCVDCGVITHYVDGDSDGYHWVRVGESLHD